MGSDFTNFDAGRHGPVPLRGLFRGRTSRKRSRTINQSKGRGSTGFSGLAIDRLRRPSSQGLARLLVRVRRRSK